MTETEAPIKNLRTFWTTHVCVTIDNYYIKLHPDHNVGFLDFSFFQGKGDTRREETSRRLDKNQKRVEGEGRPLIRWDDDMDITVGADESTTAVGTQLKARIGLCEAVCPTQWKRRSWQHSWPAATNQTRKERIPKNSPSAPTKQDRKQQH